jgi:hypothetical protein
MYPSGRPRTVGGHRLLSPRDGVVHDKPGRDSDPESFTVRAVDLSSEFAQYSPIVRPWLEGARVARYHNVCCVNSTDDGGREKAPAAVPECELRSPSSRR